MSRMPYSGVGKQCPNLASVPGKLPGGTGVPACVCIVAQLSSERKLTVPSTRDIHHLALYRSLPIPVPIHWYCWRSLMGVTRGITTYKMSELLLGTGSDLFNIKKLVPE